jgi:hypothetical protein
MKEYNENRRFGKYINELKWQIPIIEFCLNYDCQINDYHHYFHNCSNNHGNLKTL